MSEERKEEIRQFQARRVAERRLHFSEEKKLQLKMQNAKRARERRAERKLVAVISGEPAAKTAKRIVKKRINEKRQRALEAVRGIARLFRLKDYPLNMTSSTHSQDEDDEGDEIQLSNGQLFLEHVTRLMDHDEIQGPSLQEQAALDIDIEEQIRQYTEQSTAMAAASSTASTTIGLDHNDTMMSYVPGSAAPLYLSAQSRSVNMEPHHHSSILSQEQLQQLYGSGGNNSTGMMSTNNHLLLHNPGMVPYNSDMMPYALYQNTLLGHEQQPQYLNFTLPPIPSQHHISSNAQSLPVQSNKHQHQQQFSSHQHDMTSQNQVNLQRQQQQAHHMQLQQHQPASQQHSGTQMPLSHEQQLRRPAYHSDQPSQQPTNSNSSSK